MPPPKCSPFEKCGLFPVVALRVIGTSAEPGLSAADTRRNIATCGVPLNSLVDREFWVGEVLLRGTRLSEGCQHLEELTQPGIRTGLLHRAGLRARILNQGVIRIGDSIRPQDAPLPSAGL